MARFIESCPRNECYGTTYTGGTEDWGTIYELSPPATAGGSWTETILHNFTNGSDGATPLGTMTFDKNGNLFGTTTYGFLRGNVKCLGRCFALRRNCVLELKSKSLHALRAV